MAECSAPPLEEKSANAGAGLPSRRRMIRLVIVDILVLAELAAAMFVANKYQEQFTLVFVAVFFGLLIPTLSMSRFVSRGWTARLREPDSV